MPAEVFCQAWVELIEEIGVKMGWEVVDCPRSEATKVVMKVTARIVARARVSRSSIQFGSNADVDKRLKSLVHCRKADARNRRPDRLEHVLGRWVLVGLTQGLVHSEPLRSAAQTGAFNNSAKVMRIERHRFRHGSRSPAEISVEVLRAVRLSGTT
jgi:hypothetical protein